MTTIPEGITPLAWSPAKAARRAGVGETTLRNAMRAGEIAYSQIGDLKLIEDAEVRRWLRSKRPAQFRDMK